MRECIPQDQPCLFDSSLQAGILPCIVMDRLPQVIGIAPSLLDLRVGEKTLWLQIYVPLGRIS